LSDPISIRKGTRQGGITSPYLFNLFYEDMVKTANEMNNITIAGHHYGAFCYADDLLLSSLTVTGLQSMINYCSSYISQHGLTFNASKTVCTTLGPSHFVNTPFWTMDNVQLTNQGHVNYLGAVISNEKLLNIDNRSSKFRKAFYYLQGAGLCKGGVNPSVIRHIWTTALTPILTYSLSSMPITEPAMKELDSLQTKLLKTSLGLPKYCRNSPLLSALNLPRIRDLIDIHSLNLARTNILSSSRSKYFYNHLIRCHSNNSVNMSNHNDLISRVKKICNVRQLSFSKYVLNDSYRLQVKNRIKYSNVVNDGLVDSLKLLLNDFNCDNLKIARLLLCPF